MKRLVSFYVVNLTVLSRDFCFLNSGSSVSMNPLCFMPASERGREGMNSVFQFIYIRFARVQP